MEQCTYPNCPKKSNWLKEGLCDFHNQMRLEILAHNRNFEALKNSRSNDGMHESEG